MPKKKLKKKKPADPIEEEEQKPRKRLDPKEWEDAEEEPELEEEAPGVEKAPKKAQAGDPDPDSDEDFGEDDVTVIPEPPRNNTPRGPRDAIWSCAEGHETRGFENLKPHCRISSCKFPNKMKLSIVYEEKQRRPKDPQKGA